MHFGVVPDNLPGSDYGLTLGLEEYQLMTAAVAAIAEDE